MGTISFIAVVIVFSFITIAGFTTAVFAVSINNDTNAASAADRSSNTMGFNLTNDKSLNLTPSSIHLGPK